LQYKYVYYNETGFLIGEDTYKTGTKSVGDAYRCQVNDDKSYIFVIIGQDAEGNYNLLLNHNIGSITDTSSVDSIVSSLANATSKWTNLDKRKDSFTSIEGVNGSFEDIFNYSDCYARFIEDSELSKFVRGNSNGWTNETNKTWISSISNDGTVDESYWSYISSTFQVSPQNHYDVQIHGLGYDVVLAPNSGQYIRPVITVASYDIE